MCKCKTESIFVIAEAGVNHNGNIKLAKQMIDVASNTKADYNKFQTIKAKNLATKNAEKSEYQKINTKNNDTQYDMLKS